MAQSYNDPIGGSNSSVGTQLRTDYFYKKALIEAKKEQYFSQLADVTAMPKHMGKTIKLFHYMPLLDDRNVNDQGIDANGVAITDGNLYGSSKDIGTISGKMPALSENGGRVNRVGFKRLELEGSIEKFGFFDEYTQESLDFDSDAELEMHVAREMVNGASEITEDALQIDLLNGAGVVRYAGAATANAGIDETAVVTYDDLMRLAIDLDNNRTPKGTKVITGTRLVDTKTIAAARIIYVGSELLPTLRAMTDLHGNPAFVPVQQYAAAGNTVTGEVGSIDQFRIVVVPEMLKWAGEGAADVNGTAYETGGNVDVFPMLVVGDGSFTTIGFQTDGKSVKFKITHKKPGEATADRNDPYGETGFMSIKWYYGSLILRPERLAVVKTAAVL
jgi:N4-gp56 family major capsid protein